MNASKLSDVELNRAMIWLYPHLNSFIWTDTGAEVWVGPKKLTNPHWSYLLNWNLTMPLAVENGISIINIKGVVYAGNNLKAQKGFSVTMDNGAQNNNPLRAICEVLVTIALEKRK
jgi:hypothetical protein